MVEEILTALGRRYRVTSSGNYIASCPFSLANHKNGVDRHPSFTMLPIDNDDFVFHCFACGVKGNKVVFARLAKEHGFYDRIRDIFERYGFSDNPKIRITKLENFDGLYWRKLIGQPLIKRKVSGTLENEGVEDDIKQRLLRYVKYYEKRRISKELAYDFKLGYDERDKAVIFPLFTKELKLVAYSKRYINKGFLKYKHKSGFKFSLTFYGEHLLNENIIYSTFVPGIEGQHLEFVRSKLKNGLVDLNYKFLFIVEGPFDVLRIYDFGYPALGFMGNSGFEERRLSLLFGYYKSYAKLAELAGISNDCYVILLPDGDNAGKIYAEKLGKELSKHFIRVYTVLAPSGLDPSDFQNKEVFDAFLKENGIL
jgi:DNA primase